MTFYIRLYKDEIKNNMQNVIIASGEKTQKRLQKEEDKLKDIFNAESINYCEDMDALYKYIDNANTLVFYSDFPETYEEVSAIANKSKKLDSVIGVEYANDKKIWIYDGATVANCISPNEEMPAIKRALTVPKYVNMIGQWVAAIILFFLVTGAVFYSNKLYLSYKDSVEQIQVEETKNL